MSASDKYDKKTPAKIGTTGHEWDGIEELNTPLPRWWLWLFYATIIWSIGYWVVYPAWPLFPRTAAACSSGIPAARSRPISPCCRRSVVR